ncbi:putative damage-inducible protein DinB [Aquimarina sp. MAR_2010_214]|uniref:DinB family protein n=1 Tax=Aquimarina sp. MAR_2010_214 TaxID=1250026 RepID=UPI000C713AA3|nr:DinB family protein [Aquimarina sp. MAR_2010_214]PKV51088.1 putative damage-inducible protein DinB [Aquimarina sp. MAR_2010_214]
MVSQLKEGEFNPYYGIYIAKAESPDIVKGLQSSQKEFVDFVQSIPEEKFTHAYAEGKWTVAEVLQHIIDTERIFAYRALCFARNDKTSIMGFEQDDYVPYSNANNYSKEELISDFVSARSNSISLFKSFTDEMLTRIGEASGSPMSARAAGYILEGHQKHHFEVIKERYL